MLTAEQIEIRALAREFAEGELRPHTADWDQGCALDEEVFGKLAELGFLGMLVPEAYGGLDFDLMTYLLVLEELAWGDAAVALAVSIHNGPVAGLVQWHGSEEQKNRWLPALASGDVLGAFALSEPEAGSDAGALTTTAIRNGSGWRLDGEKKWLTNGVRAGLVVLLRPGDFPFRYLCPSSFLGFLPEFLPFPLPFLGLLDGVSPGGDLAGDTALAAFLFTLCVYRHIYYLCCTFQS